MWLCFFSRLKSKKRVYFFSLLTQKALFGNMFCWGSLKSIAILFLWNINLALSMETELVERFSYGKGYSGDTRILGKGANVAKVAIGDVWKTTEDDFQKFSDWIKVNDASSK